MSHTAVMRQPSILRKFSRCEPPCRPMPTMPMRTSGMGGAARKPEAGCAAAARPRAADPAATAAVPSFRNSRRSNASFGDILRRLLGVRGMLSRIVCGGSARPPAARYKETAAGMAAAVDTEVR
jgi:hypothetical protein